MIRKLEALLILLISLNLFIILQTFPYSSLLPKKAPLAETPKQELLPPMVTTPTPTSMITPTEQSQVDTIPLVISHGDRSKKEIALTFDADMTPEMKNALVTKRVKSYYNEKVITTLEELNVPATLFLTGLWMEMNPTVTQKLAKNPLFELGNHTLDHKSFTNSCFGLPSVPLGQKRDEITETNALLKKVTGKNSTLFRFPGGCYSQSDLSLLLSLGVHAVMWDDVSGDSYLTRPQDVVKTTLSHVENGSIIVLHMSGGIATATGNALPIIIEQLKNRGYSFVTISQLLNIKPEEEKQTFASKNTLKYMLTPTSFITPMTQKTFIAASYNFTPSFIHE